MNIKFPIESAFRNGCPHPILAPFRLVSINNDRTPLLHEQHNFLQGQEEHVKHPVRGGAYRYPCSDGMNVLDVVCCKHINHYVRNLGRQISNPA